MRSRCILTEETLNPEFHVNFTNQVYAYIWRIYELNSGNETAFDRFNTIIQLIKELLSYRKNAFNDGPCAKLNRNVPASITIDGIKADYRINYDHINGKSYVSIYRIKIDFESLGLIRPNKITENKQHNTMNNTKKRIIITESDLFKIVKECIIEAHGANSYDWAYYNALGFNDGHLSPDMKNIEQRYSYIINKERPNLESNRKKRIDAISTDIEDTNKIHNDRLIRNSKSLDPLRVKELRKAIGYSPSSVKFPNDFIVTYDGGYKGLDESIRRAIREVLR